MSALRSRLRGPMGRAALLASVAAAAVPACSSSSTSPVGAPSPPDREAVPVTFQEGVLRVDGVSADDVRVEPQRLLFPVATHADVGRKRPGDVLVGDRASANAFLAASTAGTTVGNPHGFLRRVVSVVREGDTFVVATENASLVDVVREGELAGVLRVEDTPTVRVQGLSGSKDVGTSGSRSLPFDFSGTPLFDVTERVDLGTATAGATGKFLGVHAEGKVVRGTVLLEPSWDVGARVTYDLLALKAKVDRAHVVATGHLASEVTVELVLVLEGDASGDDLARALAKALGATGGDPSVTSPQKRLVEREVSLGSLSLGPLKVPASAKVTADLACDLEFGGPLRTTFGATASADVTAGFRYEGGVISPVFSKAGSFEPTPVTVETGAALRARCTVTPRFELDLFGVAAAEVWATPWAALGVASSCGAAGSGAPTATARASARAGLGASVHGKVDVFGLASWEKACSLFEVASPALDANVATPPGVVTTCRALPNATEPSLAEAPLASCFGEASSGVSGTGSGTGTGSGSGTGTGSGASCRASGEALPSAWTCADARYGDCHCDCGCGAADKDCKAGECSACEHDVCTAGSALGRSCTGDGQGGACIRAICDADPYCCESGWGVSCVDKVKAGLYGCTPRDCR